MTTCHLFLLNIHCVEHFITGGFDSVLIVEVANLAKVNYLDIIH